LSLKELFSKEGRKERALQKACAKAANKKIKPDDRRPALYHLLEDGSEEAVNGLLKRFTYIYDTNLVMDEEEKGMVYDGLLRMGEQILPNILKHLKTSPTLSWGLRLMTDLCDHEKVWSSLVEIMKDYEPGYERDPSRKEQLMTFWGEFKDSRAVEVLIPFLEDDDEGIRFTTVESLFNQNDQAAREPLLKLMTNEEEESLRIKHRIADGFVQTGWTVKGFRGTVEKLLATHLTEFHLDKKGKIKLKKVRK
jgi:HEAT repeat protein